MSIKRFRDNGFGNIMTNLEGEWVLYEDYIVEIEQAAEHINNRWRALRVAEGQRHDQEIERYKRALDLVAFHCLLVEQHLECKPERIYRVFDKRGPVLIGEGPTPLEAIENAMKEDK